MKYIAIIDTDEKPVSCEFNGCNGNVTPYLIGATTNIKSLEQELCEDVIAIHTQGLDEGIRCAMCTNSFKSNRGCDGGCVVNEDMYKEVMNTIRNHIAPSVTPTPRWIPVSERLPGKNGEYLITGRKGAVNKRRYHDGHWCGNWSVLAWMPLPQPYKEGSEEI